MGEEFLKVENLSVEFNGQEVLNNLNFNVSKGEVLAVVGPNGAGKSVLFRALLGLIPYSGKVIWQKGIKIGYVPQKLTIEKDFPLTTAEFLTLNKNFVSKEEMDEVLKSVGLTGSKDWENNFLHKKIGQLSMGQLQRILIARSLVGKPDVLLFDEPTAGVDVSGEETIYQLFKKMQKSQELTLILISHDLNVVHDFTDNVLCLNKEQICFGRPHEVLDHKTIHKLYGEEISEHAHHEI